MRITYHKKRTKNTGNYENIVVEIGIEEDINFKETPEECFERIEMLVNSRLEQAFNESIAPKTTNDETKALIDKIKVLAASLIGKDPKNKNDIKKLLTEFSVSKISEINDDLLEHFYQMLKVLENPDIHPHETLIAEEELNTNGEINEF